MRVTKERQERSRGGHVRGEKATGGSNRSRIHERPSRNTEDCIRRTKRGNFKYKMRGERKRGDEREKGYDTGNILTTKH